MTRVIIEGHLEFYSETGTEGGLWSFYDPCADAIKASAYGHWPRQRVYDANDHGLVGTVVWSWHADGRPVPDPMNSDPDYYRSSFFRGYKTGDREADARLAERYEFEVEYIDEHSEVRAGYKDPVTVMAHVKTTPRRPYGVGSRDAGYCDVRWEYAHCHVTSRHDWAKLHQKYGSYEGQYILVPGDKLVIYDKINKDQTVWEGTIPSGLDVDRLFTEHEFNFWLRQNAPPGVDRTTWARWFIEEYPARLERDQSTEEALT